MVCEKALSHQNNHPCGLCCTTIKNLGVTLGKTEILRDVNIHIHCGDLTALIGPNGAGKSTLLKAILGEIPFTGELKFLDARGCSTKRPPVGYVPQRLDFDAGSPISVLDLFLASLSRLPVWLASPKPLRRRALDSLSRVQAGHLIDRRLGDLSGGELQRVLLALALDPVPALLLLDEPVSGVDQEGMELFYNLVSDIRQEYDLSIILVSHDLDVVSQYADRMIFLNKTVLFSGKPGDEWRTDRVVQTLGPAWLQGTSGVSRAVLANRSGLD